MEKDKIVLGKFFTNEAMAIRTMLTATLEDKEKLSDDDMEKRANDVSKHLVEYFSARFPSAGFEFIVEVLCQVAENAFLEYTNRAKNIEGFEEEFIKALDVVKEHVDNVERDIKAQIKNKLDNNLN